MLDNMTIGSCGGLGGGNFQGWLHERSLLMMGLVINNERGHKARKMSKYRD